MYNHGYRRGGKNQQEFSGEFKGFKVLRRWADKYGMLIAIEILA
jgi:hypothetical protein